jgi:hypothetical protein
MNVFFDSFAKTFTSPMLNHVIERSMPWDDGYSVSEITSPIDESKLRFDKDEFRRKTEGKIVLFVPNRIGGRGRSSDYTNCGKFMFDILPELRKMRQDFVVVAGNPSQKFSNKELSDECGPNGYMNIVPDALNRDEFKFVVSRSHIALGLYDQDSYGGTAARECVELGCLPLWFNCYEYSSIAREAGGYPFLAKVDWSDFISKTSKLMDTYQNDPIEISEWRERLQEVVRRRCSYEATTPEAMKVMGLL